MDETAAEKVVRKSTLKKQLSKNVKKQGFSRADQLSRLELYEKEDENNELNQNMRPYEHFAGPKKVRSMTDYLCLFFLFSLLTAQILHGAILIIYGNIERITHWNDFRDEVCGVRGLINQPYIYFLQPSTDLNVAMCVQSCPTETGLSLCLYDIDHFTTTSFCYVQQSSVQVGRVCMPNEPVTRNIVDTYISKVENYTRRIMSDLMLSWDLIIISFLLLSVVGYLLTYLLSIPVLVKYQIWIQVWCSILCFGVLSYLFWREYLRVIATRCLFQIDRHSCGGDRATLFQIACWATAGIGLIFIIYIMRMFNKINLAISLIRTSGKIVVVLSQLRFFAIFIASIGFMQFAFACVSILYGMTVGSRYLISGIISGSAVKVYVTMALAQVTLSFQGFMILFFLLFVLAVNEMFNSYALSVWFFTKKKNTVQIPLLVVLRELIMHHLGTCVFAVFMEIFLFVPKWVMSAVYSTLRSLPQLSVIVRFVQGCCLCCLSCHHNVLRYLSKHALVQVAIWSEGYWISSRKAYFLLNRNQDKVNDLDFLVEFILFLLKISTSLTMSLPIYIYLTLATNTIAGVKINDIESPLIPTMFVFMMGFFYMSTFQVSYDITTKAVIQLYLVDREMFYGEQRFCEPFIQDFMEFYGKKEQAKLKMKSGKNLKYSAQVAPLPKPEYISDPEPDESDPELDHSEDEEEEDEQDQDEMEPTFLDAHTRNGTNLKLKPTVARHIFADPFEEINHSQGDISSNNHISINTQSKITKLN